MSDPTITEHINELYNAALDEAFKASVARVFMTLSSVDDNGSKVVDRATKGINLAVSTYRAMLSINVK